MSEEFAETVRGAKEGQKVWRYSKWSKPTWTLVIVKHVGRKYLTIQDSPWKHPLAEYVTEKERTQMIRFDVVVEALRKHIEVGYKISFSPSVLSKLERTLVIWEATDEQK
jgi:hypothetical protein